MYHYAVLKIKRQAAKIRAQKLLLASQSGENNLLKEMKQIKKGYSNTLNLPECVDNVEGEDEIAEEFRTVYHELYTSADTSDGVSIIKDSLKEMISPESLHEVNKLNGSFVKRAATRMKPGKKDVSESVTSYIVLHSPCSAPGWYMKQ